MTINTKELYFILDNTPSSQNIMLVGKHGIGKSRILEDYYTKKGEKLVILFLGQMSDPGDLIGLPEKNAETGKTDFMLPYWFPVDGKPIVLFLDELNRARPEVLQTIMDLTLNRKLAGKSLPEGSRIISAVNNGNEYQLTDLDPALVSRFNIYEFVPGVQDWLDWAEKSGIDCRIVDFIKENPEYLDSSENESRAENLERSADRRSWERASQIICNKEPLENRYQLLLSGILGNKASSMFFRFVSENKKLFASTLLTKNFNEIKEELLKLSFTDLSRLNSEIFSFLESQSYSVQQEVTVIKNLELYFDFLSEKGLRELQSHFISLCSAKKYPQALYFISTKACELYKKIMDFLK